MLVASGEPAGAHTVVTPEHTFAAQDGAYSLHCGIDQEYIDHIQGGATTRAKYSPNGGLCPNLASVGPGNLYVYAEVFRTGDGASCGFSFGTNTVWSNAITKYKSSTCGTPWYTASRHQIHVYYWSDLYIACCAAH